MAETLVNRAITLNAQGRDMEKKISSMLQERNLRSNSFHGRQTTWLGLSWLIVGYRISLEILSWPIAVLAFLFHICLWMWTALRSDPFLEDFLSKEHGWDARTDCLHGLAVLFVGLLAIDNREVLCLRASPHSGRFCSINHVLYAHEKQHDLCWEAG